MCTTNKEMRKRFWYYQNIPDFIDNLYSITKEDGKVKEKLKMEFTGNSIPFPIWQGIVIPCLFPFSTLPSEL